MSLDFTLDLKIFHFKSPQSMLNGQIVGKRNSETVYSSIVI